MDGVFIFVTPALQSGYAQVDPSCVASLPKHLIFTGFN